MDTAQLVALLASQGPLGVMLVIVTLAYRGKDRELKEEQSARVTDANNYTELALDLQGKVLEAVNKLGDILEELKRNSRSGGGR